MMQSRIESDPTPDREPARPRPERGPRAYVAPAVEYLGRWSALTLAQSIPITPDLLPFNDFEW